MSEQQAGRLAAAQVTDLSFQLGEERRTGKKEGLPLDGSPSCCCGLGVWVTWIWRWQNAC